MTNKQAIISLWGAAMALIVISTGASYVEQNKADAKAKSAAANAPYRIIKPAKASEQQANQLGRQIIAAVYDEPSILKTSMVLGQQDPEPLKQEEIADITTSSVIRVFNNVEGTISYPDFDIDLFNRQFVTNGKTYSESADVLSTGTGFFIDDQGHMMTNSHVVDENSILEEFTLKAMYYYEKVMEEQISKMDEASMAILRDKLIQDYGGDPLEAAMQLATELNTGIAQYIYEKAAIDAEQTVTILDPQKTDTKIKSEDDLKKLAGSGIAATIVDWHPDYSKTHKDVAILKIANTPTPFLSISKDKVSTGQQIYIIGFPQNAKIDNSDLSNRTMTQGTINSIKKLDDVEVYQTDAKISPGSSGSPMLNEKGEVIGIISFLTGAEGIGDTFGYAVPAEHIASIMSSNNITVTSNPYMAGFVAGLNLANQSLCRKANAEFTATQKLSQSFANPSLQKYIDKCNEKIEAGDSKDGKIYAITNQIKNIPPYIGGGLVALVLISGAAWFFIRRYRHAQAAPATFVQA